MTFKRLVERALSIIERLSKTAGSSQKEERSRADLREKARLSGDPFKVSPYYDLAEPDMDRQWETLIWPMIKDLDFSCVLDLAAGHGRNTEKLRICADKVIVVDINQECIDFCRDRFKGDDKITLIKNDGTSLAGVGGGSVSLIYCFDAMVHFDSEVVFEYLREFYRVLKPGGHGFCHHSNFTGNPGGSFYETSHWRNFMSKELFAHYCVKSGLRVINSKVIDWSLPGLDCLTLFQKQPSSQQWGT